MFSLRNNGVYWRVEFDPDRLPFTSADPPLFCSPSII